MKKFKLIKIVLVFTFFIGLLIPMSNVSAATTSRRLDEVLGEYALSLVGKANDNMKEVEKYVGTQLLERFKDRTNELNSIFNGALSVDGDSPPETWDKIVDFVFPVEKEDVKITSTPALKGAIADIIINMPESIEVGSGYKYLGNFKGSLKYGEILNIPFNYEYVKGVTPDYIELKIINNTPQFELQTGLSYLSDTIKNTDGNVLRGLKDKAINGNEYDIYGSMQPGDSKQTVNYLNLKLEIPMFPLNSYHDVDLDVYYIIGGMSSTPVNKTSIFNSSYLNKSSNDVYRILNGQYGDNTTVTYNFNQTYNNFNDYGLSPDQNNVSSGGGILGTLLEFLGGIPQTIADFLDSLLGLFERIVGLFIPTSEQIADLSDSFSNISANLSSKFKPITDIGNSISSIFASPKSLYDLTITIGEEEIHVLPIFLQAQISYFRLILSGGVLLTTVIEIYKRFVGREDLIK